MKTTLMETLGTYPAPDTLDNIIFDALYEDGDFDNDANYWCMAFPRGGWNEEFGYRSDAAQVVVLKEGGGPVATVCREFAFKPDNEDKKKPPPWWVGGAVSPDAPALQKRLHEIGLMLKTEPWPTLLAELNQLAKEEMPPSKDIKEAAESSRLVKTATAGSEIKRRGDALLKTKMDDYDRVKRAKTGAPDPYTHGFVKEFLTWWGGRNGINEALWEEILKAYANIEHVNDAKKFQKKVKKLLGAKVEKRLRAEMQQAYERVYDDIEAARRMEHLKRQMEAMDANPEIEAELKALGEANNFQPGEFDIDEAFRRKYPALAKAAAADGATRLCTGDPYDYDTARSWGD